MAPTSDRADQIAEIIARRQPLAQKLNNVNQNLAALNVALDAMEQCRDMLVNQILDEDTNRRLLNIDLTGLKHSLGDAIQIVSRYQTRFSRNTLNIGVVGLARQGKSQLLRSLTGLPDEAIPAGRFGHCTGTRSTICHNPADSPHGEVTLYTEKEFVQEVLSPYFGEALGLWPQPFTLNDFHTNPLPELPAEKKDSLSARLKYEHLRQYKENLSDYRSLLSQASPKYVSIPQLREYVAQDDAAGQRIYRNYLAVREARIICTFPHNNLGQIALVDMPGMGDTGLGSEKQLLYALGHSVDAILFVKKPSGLGAVWSKQEVDLYDLARSAMPELPLERWAFLVMNHVRSSSPNEANLENCQRLLTEKSEHLRFADSIIADCADAEEANNVVLQKVLDYLTQNVERLDRLYLHSCSEYLKTFHDRVNMEMLRARDVLGKATDPVQGEFNLFFHLFQETEKKLAGGLEAHLRELRDHRIEPNQAVYESIVEAKEKSRLDTGIPSLEEIEETRNLLGSYQSACHYHLHFVRTHLTQHFESLDQSLTGSLDFVKSRIADILRGEQRGRLLHLSSKTGVEFLKDMTTLVQDYPKVLYPAFALFAEFRLSYQGYLYYRLRRHLDCLTPDGGEAQIGSTPSAQEVRDILIAMQKIAIEALKEEFHEWPIEINQAAFAIAEEFIDRILRSREARNEWQSFYMENRAQIWPEKFEQLTVNNTLRRLWLKAGDDVSAANQAILLTNN
jgi:hypothetical protein